MGKESTGHGVSPYRTGTSTIPAENFWKFCLFLCYNFFKIGVNAGF